MEEEEGAVAVFSLLPINKGENGKFLNFYFIGVFRLKMAGYTSIPAARALFPDLRYRH